MKPLLKKYWKALLIFFIVAIIIVPFLIHVCFKINAPITFLEAEWGAGDVLAFYGVLVGAVATVWGVYLSIQYSRSNYQEDVKNRVLPFIALTTLKVRTKFSLFPTVDANKETSCPNEYEEYKVEKIYYIIEKGKITPKTGLTKDQEEKLQQGGMRWEANDSGTISLVCADLVTLPLELENVGNGAAIRFRIGLNKHNTDENDWQYLTPRPLKIGESLYVHVYCEDGEESKGSYILDMVYEDIYGNKYRQRYGVVIDNPNGIIHAWIDLGCNQESV